MNFLYVYAWANGTLLMRTVMVPEAAAEFSARFIENANRKPPMVRLTKRTRLAFPFGTKLTLAISKHRLKWA